MTETGIVEEIASKVVEGDEESIVTLCKKALEEGWTTQRIIREGLNQGMREAGVLFDRHELFLPELLLAVEAVKAGIATLLPASSLDREAHKKANVVLGVVEGDVHEIGKNLVKAMLEAEGYRVIDLGFDVARGSFLEAVESHQAEVLGLSTMMTTTLESMRRTVEMAKSLDRAPLIIVGGAPLSNDLARDLGADGFGENAARAPEVLRRLIGA